jgi:hypothetical protein
MAAKWAPYTSWAHKNAFGDSANGYAPLPLGRYLIHRNAGQTRCWFSTVEGAPVGSPHRLRRKPQDARARHASFEVELRDDPVPLTEEELRGQWVEPGG